MIKVLLRFKIWNLRREQTKCVNELKKIFREVRKHEVIPSIIDERNPGIIAEGLAKSLVVLVNEYYEDTGFSFEMPTDPEFHWWSDKLIVHPSLIRIAFAEDMKKMQELYIKRVGCITTMLIYLKRLIPQLEEKCSKV